MLRRRFRFAAAKSRSTSLNPAAGPVSGTRMDAVLLPGVAHDFHGDFPESVVRIRLRIIRHGVRVSEVLADILKSLYLLLPRFGVVRLAAGPLGNPAED